MRINAKKPLTDRILEGIRDIEKLGKTVESIEITARDAIDINRELPTFLDCRIRGKYNKGDWIGTLFGETLIAQEDMEVG